MSLGLRRKVIIDALLEIGRPDLAERIYSARVCEQGSARTGRWDQDGDAKVWYRRASPDDERVLWKAFAISRIAQDGPAALMPCAPCGAVMSYLGRDAHCMRVTAAEGLAGRACAAHSDRTNHNHNHKEK